MPTTIKSKSVKTDTRAEDRVMVSESISSARQRLQGTVGTTLADSIALYKSIAADASNTPADRIRARQQIDRLLRYDTPELMTDAATSTLSILRALSALPVSMGRLIDMQHNRTQSRTQGNSDNA
jgi:hypothetical protein